VTTERIIGLAGELTESDGPLGDAVLTVGTSDAHATSAAVRSAFNRLPESERRSFLDGLESMMDFQVLRRDLVSVRLTRKRGAWRRALASWGDLTVESLNGSYRLRIVKDDPLLVGHLATTFTAFDAARFTSDTD